MSYHHSIPMQLVGREWARWSTQRSSLLQSSRDSKFISHQLSYGLRCAKMHATDSCPEGCSSSLRVKRRSNSVDEDQRNCLIMCAAIMMKHRSQRVMNYLQSLIGISLYDCHATKKVHFHYICMLPNNLKRQVLTYFRLQKFGISMSYKHVWRMVTWFGDGFDEKVKRWL